MMKISQRIIVSKGVFWLAVMLTLGLTLSCANSAELHSSSNRLILSQGFILSAYYNDQYIEVKRLTNPRQLFYGYGWIDKGKVFVAYQDEGGETYAELEIVDLRNGRTIKLEGIGGVGEAMFDVNPAAENAAYSVVYSTGTEINLLKVNLDTMSYQIKVVEKTDCWGAFWINSKTIGCAKFIKGGKAALIKYSVP